MLFRSIPGQEAKNTEYLLSHRVAVEARSSKEVMERVNDFLRNPEKLRRMREAAAALGRPHAADHAARRILDLLAPRPERQLEPVAEVV